MNIVSACQGDSLKIFLRLVNLLEVDYKLDKVGIYVSDSMAFEKVSDPRLIDSKTLIVTEWEIFDKARDLTPNWDKIRRYEKILGDPVFWNILISDRRVFFGKKCKMTQDYSPRFSYDKMGAILESLLDTVDGLFEKQEPDLVVSFGTSNVGDYLFYLMAKAKNIPFLQLKATKISNRVSFNDDIVELSSHIKNHYEEEKEFSLDVSNEAREYLRQVRKSGVKYEGAILPQKSFNFAHIFSSLIKGAYADFRRITSSTYRNDNHLERYFLLQFHEKILNPVRFVIQNYFLKKYTKNFDEIKKMDKFVFFPLHFEPEVSVQVLGRPFQNQIELVRNIALSLPAGMKVVVKEHPRSKGFRSMGYYKKLLTIPNLCLVQVGIPTNLVAAESSLVAVISGSAGLEAAIIGRPVITFGKPTYNVLPDSIVKHVENLNELGLIIQHMLEYYIQDEKSLEKYISAIIAGSAPVDLYTELLKKENRFSVSDKINGSDLKTPYASLSRYFNLRIKQVLHSSPR